MENEAIEYTVRWLREAALALKDSGGDAVVRETAKGLWDWMRTQFQRPSAAAKLEGLAAKPEDVEALKKIVDLIKDAVADGEIPEEELRERSEKIEAVFAERLPERAAEVRRNIANIQGDGNITIQDVQDSSIRIQKSGGDHD